MENNILKNHSNESEVVNSTKVVNGIKNTRKKREESSYLKVRSKAVNIFRNQIDKSVETKRSSVERALEKGHNQLTDKRAWILADNTIKEFTYEQFDEVFKLINSRP